MRCIGWDIGGAHVKAALLESPAQVLAVRQWPCPLWQGLDHLERTLAQAMAEFGAVSQHAVTMTGEMTDLFADRISGVEAIVRLMRHALGASRICWYAGAHGFVDDAAASSHAAQIASANWHASARVVAQHLPSALFIDIGSTSTDIVPINDRAVCNLATTDAERLACDELVYTGVVRTPLFALAKRAPFGGQWVATMAEYFATTADVHRLTGDLPDHADQQPSADHQDKSALASARRLARMIGRDVEEAAQSTARWRDLAYWFAEQQRRCIENALLRVFSREDVASDAPLVGAGVGRFLVRQIAQRLRREYIEFHQLVAADAEVSDIAPAVSVALLGSN